MSDADLVRQALAGKAGAYEQLVRRWSARVLAVCHARVGRSDIAEDLAQEALLRGLRGIASLTAPEKFGPWLCGIATRTALDWLKSAQRSEVPFSVLSAAGDGGAANAVAAADDTDKRDEIAELMEAVQRLPEQYREVLMHYYYQDCTYHELAELLGVSAATVNARLTRARQMLRDRLGAKGAAPRAPHSKVDVERTNGL